MVSARTLPTQPGSGIPDPYLLHEAPGGQPVVFQVQVLSSPAPYGFAMDQGGGG